MIFKEYLKSKPEVNSVCNGRTILSPGIKICALKLMQL